jgi:hypothetical protein
MVDLEAILRQKDNGGNRGTFDMGQAREPRRSRPLQLSAEYASANNEPTINNQRSMLASGDSGLVPLDGVPGCLFGKSVFVGSAHRPWLLNERMPLFFGVKYRHMKLWISSFDSNRRLLSSLIRFVSRLQLPIDCDMKWFREQRFAGFSDRGCWPIGDRLPCLFCSV